MDAAAPPSMAARVRRGTAWAVAVELVVLAVTGLALAAFYRPTASQAWPGLATDDGGWSLIQTLRSAHRGVAWLTVLTCVGLAIVAILEAATRWTGPDRRRSGAAVGPALAVLALVALISGLFLPWDQLALAEVQVGSDLSGYWPLFDGDRVVFVLHNGTEMSAASVRILVVVHLLSGAAMAGLLVSLLRHRVAGIVRRLSLRTAREGRTLTA